MFAELKGKKWQILRYLQRKVIQIHSSQNKGDAYLEPKRASMMELSYEYT